MADSNHASAALIARHRRGFPRGLTWVTREGEAELDTGLDFGIHRMGRGESLSHRTAKETAWVLLSGQAEVELEGARASVSRASLFDEAPTVVHAPVGAHVRIEASSAEVEWAVVSATNPNAFAPRIFLPRDIQDELRGKGLVQDAAVRTVRLAFDMTHRPEGAFVVGEVINSPGRWSSYPPHHHPQTELYHYRFTLPQGYGHAELGDDVHKVKQYDTVKILGGIDHPQVSAPGYGMYYLWVVRHQPGNPYRGFEFTEEHRWVLDAQHQGWKPGSTKGQ
ncbi:5-deoxy-glucuronate isomerase [Stigmatella sp. ncwal1]|uniref:5-deoxy-glucuronate isomerase n=1 Tax=Stigmatella ashevillensis TaxID=2995309 RepID=A0ABT5D9B7_9BACT|nr:5-deoxy-glucuronate isomerase [Stigmatella ashevillena]MDC0710275.1 5-deoxy-glucuronate isomerase [Stigmatella ashevillena]